MAHPNGVEPKPKARPKVKLVSYDAEAGPRQFEHLNHAVDVAKLRVPIGAVPSLEEKAKAHERIEKGHVLGRIVIEIRREKS